MSEYNLDSVYFQCGDCSRYEEGVNSMVRHLLEEHSYSPQEAENFATIWAEDRLSEMDAEDAWRSNTFRHTGHDPLEDVDEDPL